jgi:hypothetical protein
MPSGSSAGVGPGISVDGTSAAVDSGEYSEIIPLRERAIDANIVMVRGLREKD